MKLRIKVWGIIFLIFIKVLNKKKSNGIVECCIKIGMKYVYVEGYFLMYVYM